MCFQVIFFFILRKKNIYRYKIRILKQRIKSDYPSIVTVSKMINYKWTPNFITDLKTSTETPQSWWSNVIVPKLHRVPKLQI